MSKNIKIFTCICISLFLHACSTELEKNHSANAVVSFKPMIINAKSSKDTNTNELDRAAFVNEKLNNEINMANIESKLGNSNKAKMHYMNAINLDHDNSEIHYAYANFLYSNHEYQQAAYEFRAAAEYTNIPANKADAYAMAGESLSKKQNNKDSEMIEWYYMQALSFDQQNKTANLDMSKIMYQSGNMQLAQSYFDTYASIIKIEDMPKDALSIGFALAKYFNEKQKMGIYAINIKNMQ